MTSDDGHNPLPPPRRPTIPEPFPDTSSRENSPINIPPLRETAAAAENQRIISRNRLGGLLIGIVIAAGLMGVSFWWGHELGRRSANDSPIPIVKADSSPVKVVPDKPGGLQVPHRDKLVLDSGKSSNELTTGSTKIQPSPEKPVPLKRTEEQEILPDSPPIIEPEKSVLEEVTEKSVLEKVTDKSVLEKVTDKKASVMPNPPPRIAEPESKNVEAKKTVKNYNGGVSESSPEDTGANPEISESVFTDKLKSSGNNPIVRSKTGLQTAKKATVTKSEKNLSSTSIGKVYRVQLASYRSEENASNGWNKLRVRFQAILAELEPTILRVDLSDKGVFHRLQVGPFSTRAAAAQLCKKLSALNQGCLVVKPSS